MAIKLRCPTCSNQLVVPDSAAGKKVRCPSCQSSVLIVNEEGPLEPVDSEDRPPRSRHGDSDHSLDQNGLPERSGKVQAIAFMTLAGGIIAILGSVAYMFLSVFVSMGLCCLWPGWVYSIVLGILTIIKDSTLLGQNAHLQVPPKVTGIMMIINLVNFDFVNCTLGILILVFLADPEVQRYYQPVDPGG